MQNAIDGRPGDGEQFCQIADGMLACIIHAAQLRLSAIRQLRLLAFQLRFGAGGGHVFLRAHPDQVGLELGESGEDIEEHLAHWVGVVHGLDFSLCDRVFRASCGLTSVAADVKVGRLLPAPRTIWKPNKINGLSFPSDLKLQKWNAPIDNLWIVPLSIWNDP